MTRCGQRFFATPSEFRAWLEKNHATATELLVGFHKRGSDKPSITWPEAVDEALCFGWIDSVRKGTSMTRATRTGSLPEGLRARGAR